jgi:hypothetical protein
MWSQVFKVAGFSAAKVFVVPLAGIIFFFGIRVVLLGRCHLWGCRRDARPLVFVQALA